MKSPEVEPPLELFPLELLPPDELPLEELPLDEEPEELPEVVLPSPDVDVPLPLVELSAPFVPEVDEADELDDEVSSEDVSPGFALQPQPAVDTRRIPASSKQQLRAQRDTFPMA